MLTPATVSAVQLNPDTWICTGACAAYYNITQASSMTNLTVNSTHIIFEHDAVRNRVMNGTSGLNITPFSHINTLAHTSTIEQIYLQPDSTDPTISAERLVPTCVENATRPRMQWTQDDNDNIGNSYCNFTAPSGSLFTVLSSNTDNIGYAQCEQLINETGGWYARISVTDMSGNTLIRLPYYFGVKESGKCGSVGGGGTSASIVSPSTITPTTIPETTTTITPLKNRTMEAVSLIVENIKEFPLYIRVIILLLAVGVVSYWGKRAGVVSILKNKMKKSI